MTTAKLLQQWFDQVWNQSNESYINEAMHKDVVVHGLDPTGTTHGIGTFKQFYKSFKESFSEILVSLESLVYDEEMAAAHCTVSAHHIKGNHVTFSGLCVAKFKDGKLVEGWNNFDFLKMYQQLGHVLMAEIAEQDLPLKE